MMLMMMTNPKRKAVDQVNYDFSDFSLSSPATKIRRLDYGELAPIMEEDEDEQHHHHQDEEEEETSSITLAASASGGRAGEVENEERAIVLFNPNAASTNLSPSPQPPPTFSLTPHILSRFKASKHSSLFNHSSSAPQHHLHQQQQQQEEDPHLPNHCLAVVPWVHSHLSPPPPPPPPLEQQDSTMEAQQVDEEQECASMDIEQQHSDNNGYSATGIQPTQFGGAPTNVDFHHWQQQQNHHSTLPFQLPHNNNNNNNNAAAAAATFAAPPTQSPFVWFR